MQAGFQGTYTPSLDQVEFHHAHGADWDVVPSRRRSLVAADRPSLIVMRPTLSGYWV